MDEEELMVFRCRKCDHSEFRNTGSIQYCHVQTEHKSLFSGDTYTEMCGGIMEEECPSTDTDATNATKK